MANGGVPKMVQLNLADWSVPHDALATAFNERTKAIIINSPHNPTGKVFAEERPALHWRAMQKMGHVCHLRRGEQLSTAQGMSCMPNPP